MISHQNVVRRTVGILACSLAMVLVGMVVESQTHTGDGVMTAQTGQGRFVQADSVYQIVEEMPVPVGGMREFYSRVMYPDDALEAGIQGRVIVQFVVDTQGNVRDVELLRGIGGGADEVAMRAIYETTFIPGMHLGETVHVQMQLPVLFRLPSAAQQASVLQAQIPVLAANESDSEVAENPVVYTSEMYAQLDKMPEPIGGPAAIYDRVTYPSNARRRGVQGRVVVQFIVDRNGNVVNPTVIQSVSDSLDEVAVYAVSGVRFTPGMKDGEPVDVMFEFPIQFRLGNR